MVDAIHLVLLYSIVENSVPNSCENVFSSIMIHLNTIHGDVQAHFHH